MPAKIARSALLSHRSGCPRCRWRSASWRVSCQKAGKRENSRQFRVIRGIPVYLSGARSTQMGLLVDGVWTDQWYDTKMSGGRFVRADSTFRRWVTPDGRPGPSGEGGFAAAPDRYHLYVSFACPWAHRALILRKLKNLEHAISVSVVSPHMGSAGWTFDESEGSTGDAVNAARTLADIYRLADPHFTGRVTVPVLWDKTRRTIVNNESSEIIRMFNSAFDAFTDAKADYYPPELRPAIDEVNAFVYGPSTTASIAPASPPRRRPTRRHFLRCSRRSTRSMSGSPRSAISAGPHHRSGHPAVHHARALRCGLCRSFQVQSAPHRRLPEPVELSARSLSDAGVRRDRQSRPHQAALLRQPPSDQPDRHHPARPRARLLRAARPRTLCPTRTRLGWSGNQLWRISFRKNLVRITPKSFLLHLAWISTDRTLVLILLSCS